MKNKILLLYPEFYKVDFDANSYPLGLLSIGTLLKQKGYEVKLIDFLVEDEAMLKLDRELDSEVLAVGISAMTPQIPHGLELSRHIKERAQDVPVVWGGIHPTLFPEQTIAEDLIDYIIIGEGEYSFLKLLDYFKGVSADRDNINGLAYRDKGGIKMNPNRDFIDPNDLPRPDYGLLSKKTLNNKLIFLNTSRGCPYRCTFCVNVAIKSQKWRALSAARVVEDAEYLIKELGYKKIKFQEDNFFVNKQRVVEILDGIEKRGLDFTWFTSCRVNYFNDNYINEEFILRLKKNGCYRLMFGAESGSQRVLDFLKKDITPEQVIRSAELCHEHGIRAGYSFMTALPTETRAERLETLELIDKLIAIGPLIEIGSPQPYRPYPGDELAELCVKMGFKFPDKLEDWKAVVAKSMDSSSSNLEDFSWIVSPNELRLQRICSIIATSRKSLSDYIRRYPKFLAPFIALFYGLEKLRWKYKFFGLPFEYVLFTNIYWWTQKLRKYHYKKT